MYLITVFFVLCLSEAWCPQYTRRLSVARFAKRPPLRQPIRRASPEAEQQRAELQKRAADAASDPTLLSEIDFDSLELSDTLRTAMQGLGFEKLTDVQARSFAPVVAGKNVVVRARTGTGKTFAFLLPIAERLNTLPKRANPLRVLVVAPTRELAIQIGEQAEVLFDRVVVAYGGTKLNRDTSAMKRRLPNVLVATPGRLVDLVQSKTQLFGRSTFADLLHEVDCVVLDEADRILEGFSREVKIIYSRLKSNRQVLMFSATFPMQLNSTLLPKEHEKVDCIDDASKHTSERVEQSYTIMRSMTEYVTLLLSILEANEDSKIIVFFPTTKIAKFISDALEACRIPNFCIHSRMSQGSRKRVSELFRKSSKGILLSSDVSARGVDYPDVHLVVQYGAPFNDSLYLHRLGRTARAGRQGRGLLVLLPFERPITARLRKWNVTEVKETFSMDGAEVTAESIRSLVREDHPTLAQNAETACKSFVAHYLGYSAKGASARDLRQTGDQLAYAFGLDGIPVLPDDLACKLGM